MIIDAYDLTTTFVPEDPSTLKNLWQTTWIIVGEAIRCGPNGHYRSEWLRAAQAALEAQRRDAKR